MPDSQLKDLAIRHNEAEDRFEVTVRGHLAVLDYRLARGVIAFYHTGVPNEIGALGVGSRLVKHGLDHAREQGLKVRPACSFVDAYMRRHPEYQDLRV